MQFTQEQVISLAPDTASVKAGQKLATTAKWVERHHHEKALWGACKGSGKKPYQTMVDLTNLAFKCSCPSRKFPCKHALGLLFLFVNQQEAFSQETELVDYVAEWLEKRNARAEKKEAKEKKPVDAKAQQKRAAARTKKVEAGLEELRLWLKDMIRTGILQVPNDPYNFTKNITARMVDAQAGGLARQLRSIDQINFYAEGWQKQLTKQLANLYLITEAYQRLDQLTPALQQDIKSLIGWNIPKEEVLSQEGIQDEWMILSRTIEEEEKLQTERVWVYGKNSKRFGLLLNFYAFNQIPAHSFLAGQVLKAELVAYPAAYPLRMMLKTQQSMESTFQSFEAPAEIASVHQAFSEALAVTPFITQIPVVLHNMNLAQADEQWYLIDQTQQAIPLKNIQDSIWLALASSGGKAFDCFGIYEGANFELHALWQGTQYQAIV